MQHVTAQPPRQSPPEKDPYTMNTIEEAAQRLEELSRAGVRVPWAAAGLSGSDIQARVQSRTGTAAPETTGPAWPPRPPVAAPRHATQAPPSVTLDLRRIERAGFLVPTQTRSELAVAFRHIKRPLLRNMRMPVSPGHPRPSPLIMLTSALPGEGKTFCAISLAMSLSMEVDSSVLLVDADVVRPDVMNQLGVAPAKGLLDLLTDPGLDVDDVLLGTNVPKLSLLPAGTRHERSTELLASEAMAQLLDQLAARYPGRMIIFDAPPLLVTTEAQVLASHMGQVVLVVEASRTSHKAVGQALAALEQCPIVMSVLNKSRGPVQGHGYGDYYG
jgi:receptor protein-tyrosine kinase